MTKRALTVILLATVAAVVTALATPGPAVAQPQPTLTLNPPSGPCDATLEVRGSGFPPARETHETLRLYLLQPGAADVSMEVLNPASVARDGTFSQWAPLYNRGCEAATLDSQAERPTRKLFIAVSSTSEQRGVRPGERVPNVIAVAQYFYTTTAPSPQPAMVLSPSSGPCDATLEVTGHDFPPNTAIQLAVGDPHGEGTVGKLTSLATEPGGRFDTTVTLGALGCRAASVADQLGAQSGQVLWIFADWEPPRSPNILTRTTYTYTTTRVSTTPEVLPSTGNGPGEGSAPAAWFWLAGGLASVGIALVARSVCRSGRLRS